MDALCDDFGDDFDDEAHMAPWLIVGMTRGARAVVAVCLTVAGALILTRIHHAKPWIWQFDLGLFRGEPADDVTNQYFTEAPWAHVWAMVASVVRIARGKMRNEYDEDNARRRDSASTGAAARAPRAEAERGAKEECDGESDVDGATLPRRHVRQENAATSNNRFAATRRRRGCRHGWRRHGWRRASGDEREDERERCANSDSGQRQ